MLLVLLPCIYCLYFQANEYRIWQQMEEKLESGQLQTIVVPVQNFHWYEENREIIVDGMMFDVKTISLEDDHYIVTGLFDEEETSLHIAMGKLQSQPASGADTELISELISQTLIQPVFTGMYVVRDSDLSSKAIIPAEKLYTTVLSIHTPPPRSC
jgi:hypothetical protein